LISVFYLTTALNSARRYTGSAYRIASTKHPERTNSVTNNRDLEPAVTNTLHLQGIPAARIPTRPRSKINIAQQLKPFSTHRNHHSQQRSGPTDILRAHANRELIRAFVGIPTTPALQLQPAAAPAALHHFAHVEVASYPLIAPSQSPVEVAVATGHDPP
jgi:hypothetical protein